MADFTIDARQAFAQFDAIERRLTELEGSMNRTKEASKTLFTQGLESARKEVSTLDQVQREYKELNDIVVRFRTNLKTAWDPRAIEVYTKGIAEAEAEMRRLERGASAVGVNLKKSLQVDAGKGIGDSLLGSLKGAALAAGAGISFGAAIKEGIALNAEYERIKTSLTVILKDAGKADKLLGQLNQFAAETPFQSDQINQAATALLAFGESETTVIDRLREIGDISAATGKDFNELATIYGKARVAGVLYAEDINQLVEAGVPIIGEFAKQLGVSESQVKKLASEGKIGFNQLQTAFTNLTSEGGRFSGLMEAQSRTIGGILSTLKDNFSQALRSAFSGVIPILKEVIGFVNNLISATKSQSQALEDERVAFLGVANQVRLTNVGTENRTKLINTLKSQYPQFLGQINAEKATNEQLQPILDKINQSYVIRIALQKQQEKLRPLLEAQAEAESNLAKEQVSVNKQLVRAAEIAGVNISAYKTQEQQVNAVTEALKKQAIFTQGSGQFSVQTPLNDAAKALQSLQQSQIGVTVQTGRQKQEQDKVNAAVSEQQRIVEQLKKTYGEVFDLATATPAPGGTDTTTTTTETGGGKGKGKVKTAAELAFEQREKDLQIRQLLLNDLQDGLDKELEVIRLHFDQLRLEYDKAKLDTTKLNEQQSEAEVSAIANSLFAQVEADAAALESVKQSGQAYIKTKQDELEQQKAVRNAEIKLAEERGNQLVAAAIKAGAKEKDIAELQRQFDLATQKARLESELQFQQQLLAIVGDSNQEQADNIKRTIAQIKAEIGTLDIKIATPATSGAKKKQSIWDFLGIDTNTDDGKEFAAQVEQMAQSVIASLQNMAAQRVELAQQEVDASDSRLGQLENELDTEIRLAEAGFSSNVTLKRKQIEEEKKKNAAVKAELEKAKKSQLAIDTAMQASSLITSIANLFKSLSSLPFGLGVPIAIALSAAMIGFFIKSKVDASKAARARHGKSAFVTPTGLVEGRTHGQGGNLLEIERGEVVQVGDDGSRRRLEVVKRERVREYMDLLQAANAGDRKRLAIEALKLADIRTLPPAVMREIFPIPATSTARADSPQISRKKVMRRVFGDGKAQAINVTVDGSAGTDRTNHLLEQLIRLHMNSANGERWSPDGKTKFKGSTKTKYL